MKKLMYPVLALLLMTSCKKGAPAITGNGCISQIQLPALSGADSVTVAGLMKSNNLSTANQIFYMYQTYNATGANSQPADIQIAVAAQVRNGLPLFFYDITYGFANGILNGPYSTPAGSVALDNKPTLSLQKLRDSYLYADDHPTGDAITLATLKDSCLVAVFGYYDLNVDYPQNGPDFVKAWFVRPENSQWPQCYFRDDTGQTILFKPFTNGSVP